MNSNSTQWVVNDFFNEQLHTAFDGRQTITLYEPPDARNGSYNSCSVAMYDVRDQNYEHIYFETGWSPLQADMFQSTQSGVSIYSCYLIERSIPEPICSRLNAWLVAHKNSIKGTSVRNATTCANWFATAPTRSTIQPVLAFNHAICLPCYNTESNSNSARCAICVQPAPPRSLVKGGPYLHDFVRAIDNSKRYKLTLCLDNLKVRFEKSGALYSILSAHCLRIQTKTAEDESPQA